MDSYLLFQLRMFSYSLKSTLRAGFKPYAIDTGLRNRIAFAFSEDMGWLVENVIFCHLRRRHEEIYYLGNGTETDFVVKEGMKLCRRIQVWYADSGETIIPDRELACFRKSVEGGEAAELLLITNDLEEEIECGSATVRCIPATKYLLGLGAAVR
jgi:uncharacterized protein